MMISLADTTSKCKNRPSVSQTGLSTSRIWYAVFFPAWTFQKLTVDKILEDFGGGLCIQSLLALVMMVASGVMAFLDPPLKCTDPHTILLQ